MSLPPAIPRSHNYDQLLEQINIREEGMGKIP